MSLLEHLARAVENAGNMVRCNESSLLVEALDLTLECEVLERRGAVVTAGVKATHPHLFPEGIQDYLAGVGDDDETAFAYAAANWIESVFLVIKELFASEEKANPHISRWAMVSRNDSSPEEFASILYLGVLQCMGQRAELPDNLQQGSLVTILVDALSAQANPTKLMWLKSYVAKNANGSIIAQCQLNNETWPEAEAALWKYASEWANIQVFASLKQFVIIAPRE